ncbi:hypothetical protein EST38_g11631 [Candolleomyces aberdarensis]|uniref:Nephrocystin 3-like N-terminal domain-containing protein n=1 Tax=Candolleomyces aberdarensis TaxID=2316362 RepID=A0A4Q2D4D5_9AGAR|nr:hypothetical protein EST38_g11631 [Candolleomyces aberdarensis]
MASSFNNAHNFRINNNVVNVNPSPDPLSKLEARIATGAFHDSDERCDAPKCHPETRLAVQNNLYRWIVEGDAEMEQPKKTKWMTGPAGTGKTAVMGSLADRCAKDGILGATFFFASWSSSISRRRKTDFVTTVAYQLAQHRKDLKNAISTAMEENPTVLKKNLHVQMETLVLAPLREIVHRSEGPELRGAIIVDGLDECEAEQYHDTTSTGPRATPTRTNAQDQLEILQVLQAASLDPCFPFRILIASRPERIFREFFDPDINPTFAQKLDLNVEHNADADITLFLGAQFDLIRRRFNFPSSWPPPGTIRTLVENASGQFIYAATVIRLFDTGHREPPMALLEAILKMNWPTQIERRKLVKHIGGSFIFASAVFKFIMAVNTEANDPRTPMDRLPLALEMNPGLDGLYAQTLARSKHLPRFSDIISTIALLSEPLSTSAVAELLGIQIYEVVNVLVNLQAIIQVPGTDDIPVTLCHTSLRDFLTTQSRSGDFFAHPSHHVRLYLRSLECELNYLQQDPELFVRSGKQIPAIADYADRYLIDHLNGGRGCFKPSEYSSAIHLCREALALQPGTPKPISVLAGVFRNRASQIGTLTDLDRAISLYREALKLRPSPHPNRSIPLNNLGSALLDRHWLTGNMVDLEEAISVYSELLELRPSLHPLRSDSLNNLGIVLLSRHKRTGSTADLEEAISLLREALGHRPSPHPDRSFSLNTLGGAIVDRHGLTGIMADLEEAMFLLREAIKLQPYPHPYRSYSLTHLGTALDHRHRHTGTLADLEEAIVLHRETLELRPSPHPYRSSPLRSLVASLQAMYKETHALSYLQEAIAHCEELLAAHCPVGHRDRAYDLHQLSSLLQMRFDATKQEEDLAKITALKEEADRLSA